MDHNSESDDDTFTSRDFCAGSDNDLSEDDYSLDSENSVDFSFASTDREEWESDGEDPPPQDDGDDAQSPPQYQAQDPPQDPPRNDNQPQINSTDDDAQPPVPAGKSREELEGEKQSKRLQVSRVMLRASLPSIAMTVTAPTTPHPYSQIDSTSDYSFGFWIV
jgi:hypothetical protein